MRVWAGGIHHFRNPAARWPGRVLWKSIEREKAMFQNFAGARTMIGHLEGADEIERHMVAGRPAAVEIEREKLGLPLQGEACLLPQLASQRLAGCLAGLDGPARHMPARRVGVADQADAPLSIQHHGPHPHGERTHDPRHIRHGPADGFSQRGLKKPLHALHSLWVVAKNCFRSS